MQYIFSFLRNDVISLEKTPSLKEQLSAHLLDITTYREADLCDSSCITEKVFVSTVHKAKGLEFENVIIFEATDGVYPFFDKKTPEEIRESARLFYVAMTRAKIRLHIIYAESVSGISKWGNPYSIEKEPTPFLRHIANSFPTWSMHSQTLPLPPLPIFFFSSQKPIIFRPNNLFHLYQLLPYILLHSSKRSLPNLILLCICS